MSTSPNLPAGFPLTSINGFARCTAVPRASTVLVGSLAMEASSLLAALSTTSIVQTTSITSSTTSAFVTPAATVVTTSAAPATVASTPSAISSTSTPRVSAQSVTSTLAVSTTFKTSTSSRQTTSRSTSVAVAQSEVTSRLKTSTPGPNDGTGSVRSTTSESASAAVAVSTTASSLTSASSGIPSNQSAQAGPIVGGVFGGVALIGILGLILWFFRRRRRNRRESLLTPLTIKRESDFYEIDRGSVGPTGIGSKIKKQFVLQGASLKRSLTGLKDKVLPARNDTPSVNLNRGNSQFLDGPIPQHSRNNSTLSSHSTRITLKERVQEFYEQIKDAINAKRNTAFSESADPFASARSMTEQQANTVSPPDFSQLLGMDDRELQLQADRRRGSLGLNFNSTPPTANATENPFVDPIVPNPFLDPPQAAATKQTSNYVHQVRHSRGHSSTSSIHALPTTQPASRYPSTIQPSHDSFRSTIYSTTKRKVLGRSDPFDLERPELWRPAPLPTNSLVPDSLHPVKGDRIISAGDESYTSKYSSGMLNGNLDMWGDPGPDVEPGSASGGSLLGELRERGNVSPASDVSSKGGVGKAV